MMIAIASSLRSLNQVRALGMLVAGIIAFGAIFAAMNTMRWCFGANR